MKKESKRDFKNHWEINKQTLISLRNLALKRKKDFGMLRELKKLAKYFYELGYEQKKYEIEK